MVLLNDHAPARASESTAASKAPTMGVTVSLCHCLSPCLPEVPVCAVEKRFHPLGGHLLGTYPAGGQERSLRPVDTPFSLGSASESALLE
jgi:hypothetical protein